MMDVNQQLMQNLKRACASVRRHPHGHHGRHHSKHRGFGHVLDLLSETNGISQQQIADTLGIRPQSVSEAITILEGRGFIRKETSEKDRRVALIYLTEQGQLHASELAQERADHAERFFSVLSDDEKETLLALLTKVNAERERE